MKKEWTMEKSPVLQFLQNPEHHYLTKNPKVSVTPIKEEDFKDNDIILYQVKKITFDDSDEAPRKEALENMLSAVRIPGINFLYLIMGNEEGVKFYYGLSRAHPDAEGPNIPGLGEHVLQASLEGNFRGCQVEELAVKEKNEVLKAMRNMKYAARIEGVAGAIKDGEEFQGVDRLVDVMRGRSFGVLIVAESMDQKRIAGIEKNLQEAYSMLSAYSKYSVQHGQNESSNKSNTSNKGSSRSDSTGESTSTGESQSNSKGSNKNYSENTSNSEARANSSSTGESKGYTEEDGDWNTSKSKSKGKSDTHTTGKTKGYTEGSSINHTDGTSSSTQKSSNHSQSYSYSEGSSEGSSQGTSESYTREYLNKCGQEWLKYCDEVLFPRLDYGRGKGLYMSAFYVMSDNQLGQTRLENTALSLYSGKTGNRVPLEVIRINHDNPQRKYMEKCLIPKGKVPATQRKERAFLSQDVGQNQQSLLSNWISTNELALIAGLPQREVIGMRLREQVEFGLNYEKPEKADCIDLGNLLQDGVEVKTSPVYLDKDILDTHVFVAGVTGSGKTTTCQRILLQSHLPFLVIEPAKTEYRILKHKESCKDLLVFTLGNDQVAPFRLNPFELQPKETIDAHVDMIKASMEAAFEMQAAEPQLIEAALYRCYEKKGWDVNLTINGKYKDPYSPGCPSFPTISDLLVEVENVVAEQGFDDRLRDEYNGSIRAMLQSLTLGAKGAMLNTPRSVDMASLLDKKVVLELENIRSGNEKALIMGFILSAFNEAIRERFAKEGKEHAHIMLVEEAHRLLSRWQPGDGLNKKMGVETFSDMLAEIRKYGESLVIVDQIPNKMAPDVLKNTNTKIIHRIFAQDDKEAVGNTMALDNDQKRFLSSLLIGQAVVFSEGYEKAVLVKIKNESDTSEQPLADMELTQAVIAYYRQEQEKGRFTFLPFPKKILKVDGEILAKAVQFAIGKIPARMQKYWTCRHANKNSGYHAAYAKLWKQMHALGLWSSEEVAEWMLDTYGKSCPDSRRAAVKDGLVAFFTAYLKDENEALDDFGKMGADCYSVVNQDICL